MQQFSNYVQQLIAALLPTYAANGTQLGAAADPTEPVHGYSVRGLEITIPLTVACSEPTMRHAKKLGQWLSTHAAAELGHLVPLDALARPAKDLLNNAIQEGSIRVGRLLDLDEVATHQVMLDFAQTVLAAVWDAYAATQVKGKHKNAHRRLEANFEQVTERFVARLNTAHLQMAAAQDPSEWQITFEAHQLQSLPAHVLTTIKLHIDTQEWIAESFDMGSPFSIVPV